MSIPVNGFGVVDALLNDSALSTPCVPIPRYLCLLGRFRVAYFMPCGLGPCCLHLRCTDYTVSIPMNLFRAVNRLECCLRIVEQFRAVYALRTDSASFLVNRFCFVYACEPIHLPAFTGYRFFGVLSLWKDSAITLNRFCVVYPCERIPRYEPIPCCESRPRLYAL